ATVDVEDRTFWTNSGYDIQSIIRAGLGDVTHTQVTSGASTITQQLAKEYFLGPEQTATRKVKELLLARELTQTYSKRQIMELYLNLNNYGEQQYGVQAASRTYFGKDAKDLDLAQASLLAGLPQAPYDYDPVLHLQAAKARQIVVLQAMVRQGDITQEQAHQAYLEQLTVNPPADTNGLTQGFLGYVENELNGLGLKVGTQQMVVRTTLDANLQADALKIVQQNLQKNAGLDPGNLNSAAVAMDPTSGQILTYVGSAGGNTPGANYDYVNQKYVNPGSSVKPYTYGLAIQQGKATMNSKINDDPSPYTPIPGFTVNNFEPRGYGQQPLKVAFSNSLNISAVKTEMADGVSNLVDFWRGLGLNPGDTPTQPDTSYGPSLTLGGYGITLLQHAAALGTIADLGTYHQPEAILSVTDDNGKVMYQADPNKGMKPSA
ncbi:MAG: transglycosylase domain-containing protein, partial [Actinobacteria bacterium]|nr:transglycosylase domain-containing protein [Actinomycetota bacterium]